MWEAQTTPFHEGTFTGARQETEEWFSWQKQLSSLKTFTLGCLQEGLSKKSVKSIGLCIFLQQEFKQVLRHFLELFLADSQFWGNMGTILGFLCDAGVRRTTDQSTLSGTGCLQFSVICEAGNESVCFGSLSRLGWHGVKLKRISDYLTQLHLLFR